ncbi:MFS transporter, PPP family, 3-phenylpropionic acid transporter [Bosea lupini]|uniref:MFS transporter, PPP family, 3-phenylpropionic acid transporter n=1 Tax=Bosea lupini TaxID=1036779 RepID=A0A1H7KPF6_9HYPH|nr:MFS transporter, PPP family, 3-phenylpropionic acid transporter [Bosea lupini]
MSPPLRTGFSRVLALRLSLMHALNFLGVGFYLPFFPVWLASTGLGDVDIGYVLAIPILVRVFVASSVTGLGDRLRPNILLALLNALAALAYFALAQQADLLPIAVLTALSAIALSGVVPLADVLTTAQVKAGALKDYGRVRLWGSVTFVLSNLAGGYLIAQHGAWLIPFVLAGSSALAALAALQAPSPPAGISPAAPRGASAAGFGVSFWLAVGAAACVNATHAAVYAFSSLHWRSIGFSGEAVGWLWAVAVLAEIAVFLVGGSIAASGLIGLRWIAIAAVAAVLRFAAMSVDPGLAITAVLQLLHGITFGCMHLGTLAALSALSPEARRAAAQGRLVAVSALVMGLATVLSGYLYRLFGPGVFLAMVPVALLGLVLAALAFLNSRSNTGLGGRI